MTERFPTLSSELVAFAAAYHEGEIEGLTLSAAECRKLADRFKGMAVRAAWLEAAEDRIDGLDYVAPASPAAADPKIAIFPGVRRARPQLAAVDGELR